MKIEKIVAGTIYFAPHEKKKGKIKILGKIISIQKIHDRNQREYQIIKLETNDGNIEVNYFGLRTPVKGKKISGEGMYFNEKCKSLKKYRTLKGE